MDTPEKLLLNYYSIIYCINSAALALFLKQLSNILASHGVKKAPSERPRSSLNLGSALAADGREISPIQLGLLHPENKMRSLSILETSGWIWLVVLTILKKLYNIIYSSQIGSSSQLLGKIKKMFQTTKQYIIHLKSSVILSSFRQSQP